MKTISRYIDSINNSIEFLVGENAQDNFNIIDCSNPHDIWFHIENNPSCHVIAVIPEESNYNKKQLHKIAVQGCVICKQYSKYASKQKISVIYTEIENVCKLDKVGSVQCEKHKTIVL